MYHACVIWVLARRAAGALLWAVKGMERRHDLLARLAQKRRAAGIHMATQRPSKQVITGLNRQGEKESSVRRPLRQQWRIPGTTCAQG